MNKQKSAKIKLKSGKVNLLSDDVKEYFIIKNPISMAV